VDPFGGATEAEGGGAWGKKPDNLGHARSKDAKPESALDSVRQGRFENLTDLLKGAGLLKGGEAKDAKDADASDKTKIGGVRHPLPQLC
jgi:hypothetical protein